MSERFIPYRVFTASIASATDIPMVYELVRQGVIVSPGTGYSDNETIAALKRVDKFYPGNVLELEFSASRIYFSYSFDGEITGPVAEPKVPPS